MTFGQKLKTLRINNNLTQDDLAEILFVSRTAVSKWESGRGMPNIESLKALSKYFSVTIDDLLSGEELIILAQNDQRQKEMHIKRIVFGLLDFSMFLLLFLPFFAQKTNGIINEVSLLSLTQIQPYLKILYFVVIISCVVLGVLTLVLLNKMGESAGKRNIIISLVLGAFGVIIFIVSLQPYAAAFVFMFLVIKALMLIKINSYK